MTSVSLREEVFLDLKRLLPCESLILYDCHGPCVFWRSRIVRCGIVRTYDMSLALKHQSVPHKNNFFVISGCSGSGKSTLLEALRQQGKIVVIEPGRRVVKEQLQSESDGLPWRNMQQFAEYCTDKATEDFNHHLNTDKLVFFDRSLIDIVSAVKAFNLTMFNALAEALALLRYAPTVFISTPWEALFQEDEERRHGFQEAVAEYEELVPAYQNYGYNLVFLPQSSVEERVAFIYLQLSLHPSASAN